MVFVSTGLDHVGPWIIKLIIDHLDQGGDPSGTVEMLVWFFGVTVLSGVFLFFQRYLLITVSRKIEYSIRNQLFRKLQKQPQQFFDKNVTGDIMSRCTNDLDHVRDLVGPALLHIFRMSSYFLYTSFFLFKISPILAVVGLATSLILPLTSLKFMKVIYKGFADTQKSLSELNALSQETFSSMATIKSFGKEQFFLKKFRESSEKFRIISKKVALLNGMIWPTISMIGGLGICAAILTGSYLITKEDLTIGELSAAVLYLIKVQFPLVGLGWVISLIQRGRASLDRIIKLEQDMDNVPDCKGFDVSFKELRVQNLNFEYPSKPKYEDGEEESAKSNFKISDVSFDLKQGQSLGIVGKTGSGKTSLIKAIMGVYPIDKSQVFINDQDASEMSTDNVFAFYSLSPQDGFLFSESIRNNIELGLSEGSELDVEKAVEISSFKKDLNQVQGGLDALLGEKGINLSGGQRQRVGLSRSLIAGKPILILDDTLSAVDTETEVEILQNLKNHLKDLTTIIISHKYSSVLRCDEILLMDEGKVLERGTHEELIKRDGRYAQNYRQQQLSMEFEPEGDS